MQVPFTYVCPSVSGAFGIMLSASFYCTAKKNPEKRTLYNQSKTIEVNLRLPSLLAAKWSFLLSCLPFSRFYKDALHDRLHPDLGNEFVIRFRQVHTPLLQKQHCWFAHSVVQRDPLVPPIWIITGPKLAAGPSDPQLDKVANAATSLSLQSQQQLAYPISVAGRGNSIGLAKRHVKPYATMLRFSRPWKDRYRSLLSGPKISSAFLRVSWFKMETWAVIYLCYDSDRPFNSKNIK